MFVITNEPVLVQPKLNFIFYLNSTSFPPLCPLAVPVWWFGIREKKTMNCSPLNPIPSRTPFTLSCHVSLDSKKMFLMTLTIPDTGQVYCRMSLNLGLPDVSLRVRLEFRALGRKTPEVKCPHHIISRTHAVSLTYDSWCWPWPPGWGLIWQIWPL